MLWPNHFRFNGRSEYISSTLSLLMNIDILTLYVPTYVYDFSPHFFLALASPSLVSFVQCLYFYFLPPKFLKCLFVVPPFCLRPLSFSEAWTVFCSVHIVYVGVVRECSIKRKMFSKVFFDPGSFTKIVYELAWTEQVRIPLKIWKTCKKRTKNEKEAGNGPFSIASSN